MDLRSNIEIADVTSRIISEALKKSERYKKNKLLGLIDRITANLKNGGSITTFDHDFDHSEIPRSEE